jgi:uncharacterized protein (DUF433 family)
MNGRSSAMQREISPGIVVDPEICSGRPVIKGTRVLVDVVVSRLATGMTFRDIVEEYELTEDDIRSALAYAANVLASEEVRATA